MWRCCFLLIPADLWWQQQGCTECVDDKCWEDVRKCAGSSLVSEGSTGGVSDRTLVNVLQDEAFGQFSVLVAKVVDAGLADTLASEGTFTVFAPDDVAFKALPDGLLDGLTLEELKDVLLYHVASTSYSSEELMNLRSVTMMNGKQVKIQKLPSESLTVVDNGAPNPQSSVKPAARLDNRCVLQSSGNAAL